MNIANTRARLMEKYLKGVITSEEMQELNRIEDAVDEIIKQRRSERKKRTIWQFSNQ